MLPLHMHTCGRGRMVYSEKFVENTNTSSITCTVLSLNEAVHMKTNTCGTWIIHDTCFPDV